MTRYASVLGLGFGDCGKGLFVDALTRRWPAHTVVRFNGGAQAGHNVVVPGGGGSAARHHTFSQFGAGTLVPGTHTVLLDPMVVHPTALLSEAEALHRIGVLDALSRLNISAECRLTTPYHQAAGRLRERLRGASAHGTCGVGVGETVRQALERPDQVLRYGDLSPATRAQAQRLIARLHASREVLLAELQPQCASVPPPEDLLVLQDEAVAPRWLAAAQALARQCPPASAEALHARLHLPGSVLFEGAQGVLLDEWRGFHPHTTWSSITTTAVARVAARYGIVQPIQHYGVLRTYLTRHGPGPLPTHDESLAPLLPEPHNHSAGWQGQFRRGHPDGVLLRYALAVIGALSGLLVSHLDVFARGVRLRWCEAYSGNQIPSGLRQLPRSGGEDLAHQAGLTRLLLEARPQFDPAPLQSPREFLDRLAGVTDLPVLLGSHGATAESVGQV